MKPVPNAVDAKLEAELAGLASLGLIELRRLWGARIGDVPKYQSVDLLRRRLAYELQCAASGGLKPDTRRRLRQLYNAFKASPNFSPLRNRDLKVGSMLTRAWRGEVHSVMVLADGFEYRGSRYDSLSEVASKIAGAKWSGPRFFGFYER
jgi:hypothetical protein